MKFKPCPKGNLLIHSSHHFEFCFQFSTLHSKFQKLDVLPLFSFLILCSKKLNFSRIAIQWGSLVWTRWTKKRKLLIWSFCSCMMMLQMFTCMFVWSFMFCFVYFHLCLFCLCPDLFTLFYEDGNQLFEFLKGDDGWWLVFVVISWVHLLEVWSVHCWWYGCMNKQFLMVSVWVVISWVRLLEVLIRALV